MTTSSAAVLRERFIGSVSTSGWTWTTTGPNTGPLIGELSSPNGNVTSLRVYLRNVTHGGGEARPNEEYRIQIQNVPELIDDPDGTTRLLLGWSHDLEVFVGFDSSRHVKPGNSPSSIQVALATLQRAARDGLAVQAKGHGEVVAALQPGWLRSYASDPVAVHGGVALPPGDPTADDAASAAEAAARPARTSGQGLQLNHAARLATESHAMSRATAALVSEGWTVADVCRTASYDLLCHRDNEELRVEVKGTTGSGERVILTMNEVEHARSHYPNVTLMVLSEIELSDDDPPEASGGVLRRIDQWRPEDEDLRPITLTHSIPWGTTA